MGRSSRLAPNEGVGGYAFEGVMPPQAASRLAGRARQLRPNTPTELVTRESTVIIVAVRSGDPAAHAYSLDKAMKMSARTRSFEQVAAMLRE
jgi:hypothetical protein